MDNSDLRISVQPNNNPLSVSENNTTSNNALTPSAISHDSGNRNKVFLFLLFFLLMSMLIISSGFNIYQSKKISSSLPLDPTKSFLKSYGMTYYFESEIKDIKKDNSKITLVSAVNDPQLPPLTLDSKSVIYISNKQVYHQTDASQLKVGQKIGLLLIYNNLSSWHIVRVTILE